MSLSKINSEPKKSKFTKGEKCIYIHLVLTFILIIILVFIYFTHLCLVKHAGYDYYRITRRSQKVKADEHISAYLSIGVAYLNTTSPKIICNTLLLKHRWSIAPAQCILIRSNPKLSFLLQYWKIRYKNSLDELTGVIVGTFHPDIPTQTGITRVKPRGAASTYHYYVSALKERLLNGQLDNCKSKIKTGLTHSYFNSDNLENNIGVFEHVELISNEEFRFSYIITENSFENLKDMVVVGWTSWKNGPFSVNKVRPLSKEKCSQLVLPIIDQRREAEFCVVTASRKSFALDHGAVLVVNSQTVGFFSWGDRYGKSVPFVILNIVPFKNWLEFAISL